MKNCSSVQPALAGLLEPDGPKREAMNILLIQGANMEHLGRRLPELYGTTTAKELDSIVRRRARELGVGLQILYTNTEGEAVTAIYKAERAGIDGIIYNPAGFLHAGHSFRDCLKSIQAPAIEVHITNIEKRGVVSVTAEAAIGMIAGFGIQSYLLALEAMAARLSL
jgi:3-dehydroquinate dehydratase II